MIYMQLSSRQRQCRDLEQENKDVLIGFQDDYPGVLNGDNLADILKAARDNLHSIWANRELYRKGNTATEFYGILEKNMRPVYDSVRRQGYDVWDNRNASLYF